MRPVLAGRSIANEAAQRASPLALRKHYEFGDGKWIEHPLRPQKNGGRPWMKLDKSSVQAISPTDPRVLAVARLGVQATYYEFPTPSGNFVIFCPELNMLQVWAKFPKQAIERRLDFVVLGEPNVEFNPPNDASVVVSNVPAGKGLGTQAELLQRRGAKKQ